MKKVEIKLEAGWNQVGVTDVLAEEWKKADKLFNIQRGEVVWYLDRESERWELWVGKEVEVGRGYFVWKNKSCEVEAELAYEESPTAPPTLPPEIQLRKGWNLIAPIMIDKPYPVGSIAASLGDVVEMVCWWNGRKYLFWFLSGRGELVYMEPWKGYWIKVKEDCVWV